MPIVKAAITPHSPLLIPAISKDNLASFEETVTSLKKLSDNLDNAEIESILVVSPRGLIQDNSLTMNIEPDFEANFEGLGDFSTKFRVPADLELIDKIQLDLIKDFGLQLVTVRPLDYATAVALFYLAKDKDIQAAPLFPSRRDTAWQYKAGQAIGKTLAGAKKRIAVVLAFNLSHRLSEASPEGFSPKAKKFDQKIMKIIENSDVEALSSLDSELIEETHEYGLGPLALFLGIVDTIKKKPKLLSYEAPFGVGAATYFYDI